MKHIQTLNGATLKQSAAKGGCGECQTPCQSRESVNIVPERAGASGSFFFAVHLFMPRCMISGPPRRPRFVPPKAEQTNL